MVLGSLAKAEERHGYHDDDDQADDVNDAVHEIVSG
jgi:hypothetical protein